MKGQSAFQHFFKDTLIGIAIGWGGFAALLPNVLGSISKVNELGNFISLRIFSMAFFLLPVLIFTTYWWFRGAQKYVSFIQPNTELKAEYFRLKASVLLLAKVMVPTLFISNQFFLYNRLFEFQSTTILWYYLIVAISELTLMWRMSLHLDRRRSFLITCFLVFGMDLVFGLGVMAFIEPWIIYKSSIQTVLLACAFVYLLMSLGLFFFSKKGVRELADVKNFITAYFLVITLLACFPSLSWDYGQSMWFMIISGLILLSVLLVRAFSEKNKKEAMGGIKSTLFGSLVIGVAGCIVIALFSGALLTANRHYMAQRKEASKKISKDKIYPLVAYSKEEKNNPILFQIQSNYTKKDVADSLIDDFRRAVFWNIASQNHQHVDSIKGRIQVAATSAKWKNFNPKINFDSSIVNAANIQHTFFQKYSQIKENQFSLYRRSYSHEKIKEFYADVYSYIEDDLIKKVILPASRDDQRIILKLDRFFHPINYYTQTLKRYRQDLESAQKIQLELNKFQLLDSLSRITNDSVYYKKARDDSRDGLIEMFNTLQRIAPPEMEAIVRKLKSGNDGDKLDIQELYVDVVRTYTPMIVLLKNSQYGKRYMRAQVIFKSYLEDCQRIGFYILFFTLASLALIYFIHLRHIQRPEVDQEKPLQSCKFKEDQSQDTKGFEDLPGGFFNIAISVLLVLIIQIARPIKAENINPEDPYWMMDLENWYAPTVIQRTIEGKKEGHGINRNFLSESLKSYEELKEAIEESNGKLKKIKEELE